MTFPPPHSSGINQISIDQNFLIRQLPSLTRIKRNHFSWDEFGEKVARDFFQPQNQLLVKTDTNSPMMPEWNLAKKLIHDVLTSANSQHNGIRKRLGNLREPSTPLLLSTLSLWLAGILGISVSVTMPMVAVMLYAMGEAQGDPGILAK